MKVPFLDLRRLYQEQKPELESVLSEVLGRGLYLHGPIEAGFESELKKSLVGDGLGFCRGCHSGTDALILALLAAGIGPGDEVITVSHTAIPTITAISSVGAVPVFVDIDPKTWVMDVSRIEEGLTSKTKAVVPVHLYGNLVAMSDLLGVLERLERKDVAVIEDVAQAQGACLQGRQAGTWGRFGAFSFYPTKNLGAFGDGGAVFCTRETDDLRVKMTRDYGREIRDQAQVARALNSRLGEIQASLLSVRLPRLALWNQKRREKAEGYRAGLKGMPVQFQAVDPGVDPAWHLFVISVETKKVRDRLKEYLFQKGVETLIHYPVPTHLQPAWDSLPSRKLPVTEALADRILSLPCHPVLEASEQAYIIEIMRAFFS